MLHLAKLYYEHGARTEPCSAAMILWLTELAVHDPNLWHHSRRVATLARRIAARAGGETTGLGLAGLAHDLGKIVLPQTILTKPGRLTPLEWQVIQTHPDIGAALLPHSSRLAALKPAVRHHHERWDGRGYPAGLRGDAIPWEARIVALADAIDTMCMNRPYQAARPLRAALAEVQREAGGQFDPALVAVTLDLYAASTRH
jgi:HD-GYP domain-containing protein (c-di-GMP phosphodiesterase class II)